MKRVFEEISDDEWENHSHSFKPSRVLNTTTANPKPPAIESFAYGSSKQNPKEDIVFDLEDDDEDVTEVARPSLANRGRRFVVEDEDSDGDGGDKDADIAQVYNVKSSDEEGNVEEEAEEEAEEEEEDVVAKALQKCAKISAELKRDLYGSSVTACDRYAEVESSSVRIVTQVIVSCGVESNMIENFAFLMVADVVLVLVG